jgi:hypothetical protein
MMTADTVASALGEFLGGRAADPKVAQQLRKKRESQMVVGQVIDRRAAITADRARRTSRTGKRKRWRPVS